MRVENGVNPGTPDVNYFLGREGWIEIKIGDKRRDEYAPIFGTTHYGMNRDQINWHLAQHAAGGVSWVLIRIVDHLYLIEGRKAMSINSYTLRQMHEESAWSIEMPVNPHEWDGFWYLLSGLTRRDYDNLSTQTAGAAALGQHKSRAQMA